MYVGDANATCKNFVQLGLIEQLRMFGLDGLQLNRNLFARLHVCADVNVAKRPGADLSAEPEFAANPELHGYVGGAHSKGGGLPQ